MVLETMISEDLFRQEWINLGNFADDSLNYFFPLMEIATGESAEDSGTETQRLAEALIRRMISPVATDKPRD